MRTARGFLPLSAQRGGVRIAVKVLRYLCDLDPAGQGQGLGVDLGSAHHPHRAVGLGGGCAGQGQRAFQAVSAQRTFGLPVTLAGDHDVGAPRQWPKTWGQ